MPRRSEPFDGSVPFSVSSPPPPSPPPYEEPDEDRANPTIALLPGPSSNSSSRRSPNALVFTCLVIITCVAIATAAAFAFLFFSSSSFSSSASAHHSSVSDPKIPAFSQQRPLARPLAKLSRPAVILISSDGFRFGYQFKPPVRPSFGAMVVICRRSKIKPRLSFAGTSTDHRTATPPPPSPGKHSNTWGRSPFPAIHENPFFSPLLPSSSVASLLLRPNGPCLLRCRRGRYPASPPRLDDPPAAIPRPVQLGLRRHLPEPQRLPPPPQLELHWVGTKG